MYASALMAFLHHLAAFTVVAALAVEVALFKPPLSRAAGAAAATHRPHLRSVGGQRCSWSALLRVAYFEKGPAYYWHDEFFLVKFAAFIAAALISIYPTHHLPVVETRLKAGTAPQIAARTRARAHVPDARADRDRRDPAVRGMMARGLGYLR